VQEGENICFEVIDSVRPVLHRSARILRARFSALAKSDVDRAMATLGEPNANEAQSVDARQVGSGGGALPCWPPVLGGVGCAASRAAATAAGRRLCEYTRTQGCCRCLVFVWRWLPPAAADGCR
jgi:hypothetical protein